MAADDAASVVRAAGGVVTRLGPGGLEVLLVHRPRYDDWTLPKGKAERGETATATAQREVLEETGFACTIGPEITEIGYIDNRNRPKVVRYFAMRVERGAFTPNGEVDEILWCPAPAAADRLSYPRDRDVLLAGVALSW